MNKKVLSIVVPSYNAEKFLHKGIPTLLDKRVVSEIEVIIVDDGSKDSTAKIADKYAVEYPDTVVVVHKENGGHGSTINSGIEIARGKYFCVIDADDWVDSERFVELIQKIRNGDSDLYLAHATMVDPDGKICGYEKIEGFPFEKEIDMLEYIDKIVNICMHNYYIRTSILRENLVRCHEHHFYVDQEYVLYSLLHVKTVTVYDISVYQYLVGRDGQSISIASKRKNQEQYLDVIEYLSDFYKKKKAVMTQKQRTHYENKIAWLMVGHYGMLLSYAPEKARKLELIKVDKWLKKIAPEVYAANMSLCVKLLRMSNYKTYFVSSILYRIINKKRIPE